MNDQELEKELYDLFATDKSLIEIVDATMEFIRQDQALREIDIRIEELESFCGHSNEIPETEIKARVKELQAKKDKLIKGDE